MAAPPRLTYDGENRPKVKASLSGGRFHFTLRDGARELLVETLSYDRGEEVPWQLFKLLVLVGDANFPNVQDGLDLAGDLVEPSSHREPTDREARTLASHLEAKQLTDREVSALATELTAFGLDSHVDFDRLGDETADDHREIAVETDAGSVEAATGEPAGESADSATESATEPTTEPTADSATESSADAGEPATDSAAPATDSGRPSSSIDDPLVQTMMLLSERLVRSESASFDSLSNEDLIDLYTLLSEVQSAGGDRRTEARDVLVERIKEDAKLEGSVGTIERKTRRRKSLRDEHEIFDVLADAGVGHTEVMSVELDKKKLQKVAKAHDIPEEELFEIEESGYVRRVSTDEDKLRDAFERLQGSR